MYINCKFYICIMLYDFDRGPSGTVQRKTCSRQFLTNKRKKMRSKFLQGSSKVYSAAKIEFQVQPVSNCRCFYG